MRLCYFAILLVMLAAPACALDTGIAPSERAAAAAQAQADAHGGVNADHDAAEGGTNATGAGPGDTLRGALHQAQGVWPTTYTTTLTGGGWTLEPLGAQRGASGTLSAPDGSLHLEALP